MRSFLAQRPKPPLLQSFKHQVQISGQIGLACTGGCRMRSHHEQTALGEPGKTHAHQLPEPSLHPVANHRRANRTAYRQAYSRLANRRDVAVPADVDEGVHGEEARAGSLALPHDEPEVLRASHPRFSRQHSGAGGERPSGAQARAALAAAGRDDRPASAGTHAQPEAMNLRAPTVVRLKRTLAHWSSRVNCRKWLTQKLLTARTRVPSRLSLLTVWAMPTEVKPGRRARSARLPFYQVTRPAGPGRLHLPGERRGN